MESPRLTLIAVFLVGVFSLQCNKWTEVPDEKVSAKEKNLSPEQIAKIDEEVNQGVLLLNELAVEIAKFDPEENKPKNALESTVENLQTVF